MRFAPLFLLATVSLCSAQTGVVPDKPCMAARILTPRDTFPMPIAKTPEMPTAQRSITLTAPACAQAQPKTIEVKGIRIQPRPPLKPGRLELLPNPFTPLTK